nr:TetR/AcrR family transcriptional regulator [Streptomyces sp. SID13031]
MRADSARIRERVIAVARQELAEGAATLSMNALAARAGVGVGTVYRHFPTVQVLLEALAIDSFRVLVEEVRVAAERTDVTVAFEDLMRRAQQLQLGDPALALVLASPEFTCDDVLRLSADLIESMVLMVRAARRAGAIRDGVDGHDLRRLLTGLHQASRGTPPDTAERYLQILLQGLRP